MNQLGLLSIKGKSASKEFLAPIKKAGSSSGAIPLLDAPLKSNSAPLAPVKLKSPMDLKEEFGNSSEDAMEKRIAGLITVKPNSLLSLAPIKDHKMSLEAIDKESAEKFKADMDAIKHEYSKKLADIKTQENLKLTQESDRVVAEHAAALERLQNKLHDEISSREKTNRQDLDRIQENHATCVKSLSSQLESELKALERSLIEKLESKKKEIQNMKEPEENYEEKFRTAESLAEKAYAKRVQELEARFQNQYSESERKLCQDYDLRLQKLEGEFAKKLKDETDVLTMNHEKEVERERSRLQESKAAELTDLKSQIESQKEKLEDQLTELATSVAQPIPKMAPRQNEPNRSKATTENLDQEEPKWTKSFVSPNAYNFGKDDFLGKFMKRGRLIR